MEGEAEDETEASEESEADEQEVNVSLVPKPRTKSAVWNYFRVESNSDGQPSNLSKPVCTKCLTAVSAMHGNTSNLFTHLHRNTRSCSHKFIIKGVARSLAPPRRPRSLQEAKTNQ